MRVDLDIPEKVLEWAEQQAKDLGMSRRAYLTRILIRAEVELPYEFPLKGAFKRPLTPDECIETKPESNE